MIILRVKLTEEVLAAFSNAMLSIRMSRMIVGEPDQCPMVATNRVRAAVDLHP